LVETSSSSSDSDDNNYDPVRLMENHNPMVRLITYGKVKKMMMQFQNKNIDYLEKNMMRGMFRRKLKDFAELQKETLDSVSLLDRFKKQAGDKKAGVSPRRDGENQPDQRKMIKFDRDFSSSDDDYNEVSQIDDYRKINWSRLGKGKFREDNERPTPGSTFSPNPQRAS